MFDIDSGKLLIVAVLALIVIGPKELPRVLRQLGQAVGKMRRMAGEFQGQFMDAMKEADIADIRKELAELKSSSALDVQFDPVRDIQTEMTSAMAPVATAASEATLHSPTEGFSLPSIEPVTPEGPQPEPTMIEEAAPMFGDALANPAQAEYEHAKTTLRRKIFVKRRASRFHIVQAETKAALTGQPLATRRLAVRAKPLEIHGTSDL